LSIVVSVSRYWDVLDSRIVDKGREACPEMNRRKSPPRVQLSIVVSVSRYWDVLESQLIEKGHEDFSERVSLGSW